MKTKAIRIDGLAFYRKFFRGSRAPSLVDPCGSPGTEIIKQVKQKIDRLTIPGEFTIEPVLVTSIDPKKAVVESGFLLIS